MQIEEIHRRVLDTSTVLDDVRQEIAKVIVGQEEIIERLLIGLLCNGHVLLEGVPGLAKTLIISTLALSRSNNNAASLHNRADECALKFDGAFDRYLHERFENMGFGPMIYVTEGTPRGGLECVVGRIDGV